MKVYEEISLKDFEFWSGAIQTAKYLTNDEMDAVEENLSELNPDGMSKTDINDFSGLMMTPLPSGLATPILKP